jgi:hypothetical protein
MSHCISSYDVTLQRDATLRVKKESQEALVRLNVARMRREHPEIGRYTMLSAYACLVYTFHC